MLLKPFYLRPSQRVFCAVDTSFRASIVLSILGLLLFTLSDPSQSLPTLRGSILPDWTKGPLRPPNDSLVYTFQKILFFCFNKVGGVFNFKLFIFDTFSLICIDFPKTAKCQIVILNPANLNHSSHFWRAVNCSCLHPFVCLFPPPPQDFFWIFLEIFHLAGGVRR